jgi:hypothetical protein
MWFSPDSLDKAFVEIWDNKVEKQRNSGMGVTGFADYRRAKLRAQRRATAIADYLRPHDPSVVGVEEDLVSPDGLVQGRVDLIVRGQDGTEIVDYKTGGPVRPSMLERFRRQLLLYAGIEMECTGTMPVAGFVLSTSSMWNRIELDLPSCQVLLSDVRLSLSEFNQTAPGPQPATPGSEACRSCGHSASCEAFWQSVQPEWLVPEVGPPSHAVAGRLLEAPVFAANGRASLRIDPIRSTVQTDGAVEVVGIDRAFLGEPARLIAGATVRLVGLRTLNDADGGVLSGRAGGLRIHID